MLRAMAKQNSAGSSTRNGTYTRETRIGQGPHAEVWRAQGHRGPVALKVATSEQGRQMLLHEGKVLDPLRHACVVQLEARDPKGGWIAVELVEGGPVDQWAVHRSPRDIAGLLARVADGLAFLHAHRVVHGDIKPSNLLVDERGAPRIIDLGLATVEGQIEDGFRGTLGYAAPELLRGQPPTPASDIYALGATAYQLVTGHRPFEAADPAALAVLPLQTLPASPSSRVPDLPQPLSELILRMMARDPSCRPVDAGLVGSALRSCGEGAPGPTLFGMERERENLRRLVVQGLEGRPAMVVLHGPPGSGRSSLIREATEYARREGMQWIRPELGADAGVILETMTEESARRPCLIALDTEWPEAESLASRLFARRLPGLVLVRAPRPMASLLALGARHITPSPLGIEEIETMLVHAGHDPAGAPPLLEMSGGRPGTLRALLDREAMPGDISDRERQVLLSCGRGPLGVTELARRLDLSEHDLLDLIEPLFDRGLLLESSDGSTVERAR